MRRLTVAVLVLGSLVAAQKLRTKGTDMEMAHNVSIPELTEAISTRLVAQWEGWKNQDPAPNDAIIADDFHSTWPDGSRHVGRPTPQQMAEQPITGYKLSQFRGVPVGADAALVSYLAESHNPRRQRWASNGRGRDLGEAQRPVVNPRLLGHTNENELTV